jgi:proteasome lid subunit RPN8/RPN11
MTERLSDTWPGTWEPPECPLLIEYAPAVLDEIRLRVVDAFFSLPRGGAEIGGILFGLQARTTVRIEAFRPMECEHAMGPTFVLSDKDQARLKIQLDEADRDPLLHGMEVVGWYHSHTRSEIFLSNLDLEIYNRFFPKPWQVALVMRPAGMKPTRAGFFFRGRDGSVRSSSSYREFIVRPLAEAQVQANGTEAATAAPARRAPEAAAEPTGAALPAADTGLPTADAPEPSSSVSLPADSGPTGEPTEFLPPAFMLPPDRKPSRAGLWIALALLATAGAGAYLSSRYWMPLLAPKPLYLHLRALDSQGQLRIQWDRSALASLDVQGGALEILDGAVATTIPLNATRLRSGSFQYQRRNNVVEVHLTVKTARGAPIEEFTSFYGLPRTAPEASAAEQQKQAAELAAEAEKARGDLKKQEQRTLELQRSLEQMRQLLRREEERKRVENQMPAAEPAGESGPSTPLTPPPDNPPQDKPQGAAPSTDKSKSSADRPAPSPPEIKSALPSTSLPVLSGRWVYSPAYQSASPFPPEFVTLTLVEASNEISGTLAGRYKVPKSNKMSSRVNFNFKGPLQPGPAKFKFTASDGMKGQIELMHLPGKQNAIEVVWYSERDKLTFDDIFFRAP